jgi:predicted O-methyltransferase YrrM
MNPKKLAKRLPRPVYVFLRSCYQRMPFRRLHSAPKIAPGPLVTQIYSRIHHIPGWFNLDDCAHFTLILKTQTVSGVTGDMLEIGSYHGRSTCVLGMSLNQGERLLVCDVFDLSIEDPYGNPPTKEMLYANLKSAVPNLSAESVEIHGCYSRDLSIEPDTSFRFIHIDGGHDMETVLQDLRLCALHLMPGGVMALDDYCHPLYPEVTQAVAFFLQESPDIQELADLNRQGALGRKLYLYKTQNGAH